MPASTEREPGISRIYSAFDEASHAVFRSAMTRSRGGVVRVDDLLAALAEYLPEAATCLGGRRFRPGTGPNLVPMANEPALRELLARAYRLAGDGLLTPSHLLEAAVPARAEQATRRPKPPPPRDAASLPCLVEELLGCWVESQERPATATSRAAADRVAELVSRLEEAMETLPRLA